MSVGLSLVQIYKDHLHRYWPEPQSPEEQALIDAGRAAPTDPIPVGNYVEKLAAQGRRKEAEIMRRKHRVLMADFLRRGGLD